MRKMILVTGALRSSILFEPVPTEAPGGPWGSPISPMFRVGRLAGDMMMMMMILFDLSGHISTDTVEDSVSVTRIFDKVHDD